MRNEHQLLHAILATAPNAGLTLLYVGTSQGDGSIWGSRVVVAAELTAADIAKALGRDGTGAVGTVQDELERQGFVCHEIEVDLADEYAISRVIHYDAATGRVRPWRLFSPMLARPDTAAILSLMENGILTVGQDGSDAADCSETIKSHSSPKARAAGREQSWENPASDGSPNIVEPAYGHPSNLEDAAELFYRAFPDRRRHNPQSVEFELQLEGWTDEQIIDTGL